MLPHPKFKPRPTPKGKHSKYVLLRGHEHNNIFWTSNTSTNHEGFDVLYEGNDTKEMVEQWTNHTYNRLPNNLK